MNGGYFFCPPQCGTIQTRDGEVRYLVRLIT
jgi:hypothetical protein